MNITVNGKSCTAKQGQTILQACKENGADIPTLCHDERLRPFGSCMLCRVEVEGARGTMLACGSEVTEGMVISTETDEVKKSRKACLELLLSQHYGDCTAPCVAACPAHVDVQGYLGHIANGQFAEALRLIKERNPLPVVCGRICTRPCEAQCRRNILEGPLGIAYLKRFVADLDMEGETPYLPEVKKQTGKYAAVIGAGPAGLSAAWYLAQRGHSVTIFEKHPNPGGMLRYGIPAYRMPREALDREVAIIRKLGVEIIYNTEFGKDVTVESLKKEGFGAILLAVGSQVGQPLGVPGEEECPGVLRGVDFLGNVTKGTQPDFDGKKVVVVGGGNTAMDCCRTALRLGAETVTLVYRRSRAEMPADKMEIHEAELEGTLFSMLTNPVKVESVGAKTIVTLIKMELGEPDASGRRSPKPVSGSEYELPADFVISAIGQTQDLSFVGEGCQVDTERNRLVADETGLTNLSGVFAAGDAVSGPKTAIAAIAGGRTAALAIDQYLLGREIVPEKQHYNHIKAKHYSEIDPAELEGTAPAEKIEMPQLSKTQRECSFDEVELGFNKEQAMKEAARCLSCGCKDVNECKLREYATQYSADQYGMAGELMNHHPIDESHPFISRDKNKCILCGRCVRICTEVTGRGVFGFMGRGYGSAVEPSFAMPFGEEKNCVNCGQCVSTCPVGALIEKTDLIKPGPFAEKVTDTVCTYCGAGCSIELRTNGQRLIRTTADCEKGINHGNLCEKGRFHNAFIHSDERLKTPYIKRDGKLVPCTIDEALSAVRNGIGKNRGNDFALYLSGRATNENAKRLAGIAGAQNSDNVLSFGVDPVTASLYRISDRLVSGYEDIKNADLVVALNCNLSEHSSVPMAAVSRAVREGAELITANSLTEEVKERINAAHNPLIVTDVNPEGRLLSEAAQLSAKLLVPALKANTRGVSEYLNLAACSKGAVDAKCVLIWGEDPAGCGVASWAGSEFTVVCDLFMTETAKHADVVLPMPAFSETQGSFTNIFGNTQELNPAYCDAGTQVVNGLCAALGEADPKQFDVSEILSRNRTVPGGADVLEDMRHSYES